MFIISGAAFVRRNRGWLLAGLVFIGFALRLPGVWANTFHADEALFAFWARLIAVWRDPLLQSQVVDKPPLLFYAQALFYPLMATPAGWPARLPNLIGGVLLIPLTGRLAHQLYGDRLVPIVAATIVTFSPLAIQFSASAFIDPLLVTLLVAALVLVASRPERATGRGRLYAAGFLFGLALLTKFQAVLFLPLILGVGWLSGWKRAQWGRWVASLLPLFILFVWWGLLRSDVPEVWSSQWQNFGGLRLALSWELGPRLWSWSRLGRTIGGVWVGVFILVGTPLLVWGSGRAKTRGQALDLLLALFVATYLALHWLVAIPVWDRYLLPLVPLLAVLAGRVVSGLVTVLNSKTIFQNRLTNWEIRFTFFVILVLVLLMFPGAIAARWGAWPVGARPEADSGATEVAAWLADAPYGTVLYDHWFSWHWRYYFFDSGVYTSWFAHPAALAEDLSVFGDDGRNRFLVLPAGEAARPVERAVNEAGFRLEPVYTAPGMVLYQVEWP